MNTQVKMPVGVVGLGAMGMGVALSLVREGFEVHAFDLRPEAVQRVVDAGGHAGKSLASMAELVDVLITVVVNAEQTEALRSDQLYISQAFVDEGVTMRRIRPRAKGSASRILKRSSHITVVVEPKSTSEKGA